MLGGIDLIDGLDCRNFFTQAVVAAVRFAERTVEGGFWYG